MKFTSRIRTGLFLVVATFLICDTPVAYADNCGSLSDCFFTIAAALAIVAMIALLIAGLISLGPFLAGLGGMGGGFALAGGGTLAAGATAAGAVTATNIATAAAAAAAASAAAGTITMMASQGTPGNNQAQNKQFNDAVRTAERQIGRRLSKAQRRRVHDEITGQNMGFWEIVEVIKSMFGG